MLVRTTSGGLINSERRKHPGEFKRGISQYPTIGDEAHLVSEQDLTRIYGRQEAPNFVRVGSLASADSIPALIDIDRLVTGIAL